MTWCTPYTGCPGRFCTDQGSVFTSNKWKLLTYLNRVKPHCLGITAQRSLEMGERYYEPSGRFYCRIKFRLLTTQPSFSLLIAVKAMNDIMRETALVSSCPASGILQICPSLSTDGSN